MKNREDPTEVNTIFSKGKVVSIVVLKIQKWNIQNQATIYEDLNKPRREFYNVHLQATLLGTPW